MEMQRKWQVKYMAPRIFMHIFLVPFLLAGCVSVDEESLAAREAIKAGQYDKAVLWSEELATDSVYAENLGTVEAGRVAMLRGDFAKAEAWFRKAVDSAVDRKERAPKIKLGDVGNTVMAATITDDRTREYYLQPYELNLALGYGILAQAVNGKKEDALADARLAVYIQDSINQTYGADIAAAGAKADAAAKQVCGEQTAAMQDVMEGTRNSWENPVLWWLTGVLFEADNDLQMAWTSYRKARAVRSDCAVFAKDAARAETNRRTPANGKAKLVVLYEEGLVPMRQSLKVPVPIYTMMSVDIPQYDEKTPYLPNQVAVSGAEKLVAASPALNVRALAYRDLDEQLPGIVTRNITRAAVAAGAQTAVNLVGNEYAQLAVFAVNTVATVIRSADTRSWVTLPDGQQVWEDGEMLPGAYQIGVSVNGRTVTVPVALAAGETKLLWIADTGREFRSAVAEL